MVPLGSALTQKERWGYITEKETSYRMKYRINPSKKQKNIVAQKCFKQIDKD